METEFWQWLIVGVFGVVFFLIAPYSKTNSQFYNALTNAGKKPGTLLLTSSLLISWIFAKSITNVANLGMSFGIVGGVAYSIYYLSFLVAGIVIYKMRVNGHFQSIHGFLETKFGKSAIILFSLLIGFRLFNEIWSNTMVIGSYFGAQGSDEYYWAVIVFTFLTLAYVLKGGLRSSLLTDAIQLVFFGVLLFVLLGWILPTGEQPIEAYIKSGSWTMAGGLDLAFVAAIQIFSYPFHDPVLTDRGFISSPQKTIISYFIATVLGVIFLILFSFVGVFAQFQGLTGQAPVEVSKLLGVGIMLVMNCIMITSAASTLDSSFTSFAKMMVVDLGKSRSISVRKGQIMMVVLAIAGTLPVFLNPTILSATTISGTMVIGLAPIFLLWRIKAPIVSYYASILVGVFFGVLYAAGFFPESFIFTEGKYAGLLWSNIWGSISCFVVYLIPIIYDQRK